MGWSNTGASYLFASIDELHDTDSLARPNIEGDGRVLQLGHEPQVGVHQVRDMDEVPHARAVPGRVAGAHDGERRHETQSSVQTRARDPSEGPQTWPGVFT